MSDPAVQRLQRDLGREALRAQGDVERLLGELGALHAEGARHETRPLVARLAAALSRVQACADLSGRLVVRFDAAPVESEAFATARGLEVVEDADRAVPWVRFDEAVEDLRSRQAFGAEQLRAMALAVEDVYGPVREGADRFWRHGFALAQAADAEVAARVQERLAVGLSKGTPTEDVARDLATRWDFPASYARMIVRTNFNTAQTAGRFREAERVHEEGFRVGFRFDAVMDSDTRPGHAALDGLVARVDDPVWRAWSPPLGYQCRCVASPVLGDDVPTGFVSVPSGAAKTAGFGGRPDLGRY